jgi:hypothetical protein
MFKKCIFVILLNFVLVTNIQAKDVSKKDVYKILTYIFNHDMMLKDMEYLNYKIGMFKVNSIQHSDQKYRIGQCTIGINYGSSVRSITLDPISDICNFNASNILLKNENIDAYKLTYGDIFGPDSDYKVQFGCLSICGTSGIKEIVFLAYSSAVDKDIRAAVSVTITSNSVDISKKFEKLANTINQIEKDNFYVTYHSFNEKGEYNKLAYEAFKDVYMKSITLQDGNIIISN